MLTSNGFFDVVYVDDPRIRKHFTRELEGVADVHIHYDPRAVGVFTLPVQAKMWPGEYVEFDLPDPAVLLGIITELAAHHPRAWLYVNGHNQTPQYLDTFLMGQVDSVGSIKWFFLPSGKKTVKILISDSYNPNMAKTQRARGSGFCFGGYIACSSPNMPTPAYSTVGWTLGDLNEDVVPAGGVLDVADVPHPCELQLLKLTCDTEDLELRFIDGFGAGTTLNANWTIGLSELYRDTDGNGGALGGINSTILKWEKAEKSVAITLPSAFMSGMRIQLLNTSDANQARLLSLRCLAKVQLC